MAEAALLLETGWTHDEYEGSPDYIIDAMFALLNARAEAAKERSAEGGQE